MTGTPGERSGWREAIDCRREAWRAHVRQAREGKETEVPGPPSHPFTLLPWLLLGMGAFSNLFQGESPNPWLGGLGLLTFNSCYIYVAVRAFVKEKRESLSTRLALAVMTVVTVGLALGYGGSWVLFFPLLGLATGASLRGRPLGIAGIVLAVVAGAVAFHHDGWGGLDTAYATWISTIVTAVILSLAEAVRELRAAREELARQAVDKERLRFSRDLHDLLGHTLSVIVVKSEAARRLAPARLDAALTQIADIESVGRQALTEIREAVTGYREGSLAAELDRAHSALTAAGVEPSVHRSGAPVEPQTAALLGWVVREAGLGGARGGHQRGPPQRRHPLRDRRVGHGGAGHPDGHGQRHGNRLRGRRGHGTGGDGPGPDGPQGHGAERHGPERDGPDRSA